MKINEYLVTFRHSGQYMSQHEQYIVIASANAGDALDQFWKDRVRSTPDYIVEIISIKKI